MRAKVHCAVWLALGGLGAIARGQVSKPGTGTVTGHVVDAATKEVKLESGATYSDNNIVRSYHTASQQLMVTDSDVMGRNIELMPVKPSNADADAENGGQQHAVIDTGH